MRKGFAAIILLLCLSGCSGGAEGLNRATDLRQTLLNCESCSFRACITADYGDSVYSFTMDCKADSEGNLDFTVVEPENIRGISGNIRASGGSLTFSDTVLAFSLLADGEVSPVSAPWILLKALRGGYISSCAVESNGLQVSVDDSYEEDALRLDVWLDSNNMPTAADILWQGRRVLSLKVENFVIV